MDEELIILEENEIDIKVDAKSTDQDIDKSENIEYIEVNEPEEVKIEIEESMAPAGVGDGNYAPAVHTHPTSQIEGLDEKLKSLGSAREYYSSNGGYAEFRQWSSNETYQEVGRFVSLVYQNDKDLITGGNTFIRTCTNTYSDVYGVTVGESAFCGYQDPAYNLLNSTDTKYLTDYNFAKVCLLGVVSVRQGADYKNAKVGDYVVPDNEGCAILSDNGIGFRVVGVGQYSGSTDYWNYSYVNIALVSQNDNVARVMAELEGTKQNLGNLSIQIGKLEGDINNTITSIIPGINETLAGINGAISDTQGKLNAAQSALEAAQNISSQAQTAIETAKKEYKEAISDAQQAVENANNAVGDITDIKENMTVLKQYKDKIVGFFDEASEDEASLATLVRQNGDITLIKQKIDENGAAIQHLVAHADKYSVGKYSPTYGLSYEQALGILGQTGSQEANGYIYVPTEEHTEESTVYDWLENKVITFKRGTVYVWKCDDNGPYDTEHRWQETSLKVAFGNMPTTKVDGDLWYTWNGVVENSIWIYQPQTLYRWTAYNETDGIWIAVARANDSNARTMSFINQTAEAISSTVTNLEGNVSEISQTVDVISSTILGDDGIISRVNQTAEAITLGTYSPNKGMSSLEILLNGMRSTTSYDEHILVGEFGGGIEPGVTKYKAAPTWGDGGFSFADGTELTEEDYPAYYFDYMVDKDGNYVVDQDGRPIPKTTYYCKQIDDNTYEIYTIGNQAMANISTRVDKNESAITRLTQFETDAGTRLTAVEEKSDANGAQILSIAQMNDVICTKIASELTEEEIDAFDNAIKYSQPPQWNVNEGKFEFTVEFSDDGIYCILNDTKKYYEIIDTANGQGYKQYEVVLPSIKYATIEQKVNDNGASIGMVVENGGVKGSVIAQAINDQSKVTINANRISINGTTTFADALNPEKTAISGDYIKTGIIASNNYSGPITYRMYGAKVEWVKYEARGDIAFSFISGVSDYTFSNGTNYGETDAGVIGTNLDIAEGDYDCVYDNKIYTITVYKQEVHSLDNDSNLILDGTVYLYKLTNLPIPNGESIDAYTEIALVDAMKIVQGDFKECIYYTPRVPGTLSPGTYYYTNDIKVGEILSTTNDNHQYIVSATDFDLIPSNIETQGTKFDLNVGTIFSKHFSLDREGDLTIDGRITATSGYIGDGDHGFTIDVHGATRTYTVGEDGLEADWYYFKHNGKYYKFEIEDDLSKGNIITMTFNENGYGILDEDTINPSDNRPSGATYLSSDFSTDSKYYLSNQQSSLWGTNRGSAGVYISPLGIGLGNGNFVVDNEGNVTMNGSITLNGSISWGTSGSMVQAMYSSNGIGNPDDSPNNWDEVYDEETDSYAAYSYDRGESWTVIKIRGEDGSLDLSQYPWIQQTYIDFRHIESPALYGGEIVGSKLVAVDLNADIETNDSGLPIYDNQTRMEIGPTGIISYDIWDDELVQHGIVISSDNFSDLQYYYLGELRGGLSQDSGNMGLYGKQRLYIGRDYEGETVAIGNWYFGRPSSSNDMTVDFTGAKVTGLKITFG